MKYLFLLIILIGFSSCKTNYTLTTFYVKNPTAQSLNFKASIIKYNSMGPYEMTLPFTVLPGDSVLARQVKLRNDIPPNKWFTQFVNFPVEGIVFNDPNLENNWVKSIDEKGKPVFTFTLAK
ncbi:hypothetical protein [Gynurincola endophyticus]|uniref:hypothetical protein n=1 Tax=Gynurincola endophyticus TaxID=2479004 RepID=UPI000F8D862C|nr:hypothetical protein [Gynurincola endophyticus]